MWSTVFYALLVVANVVCCEFKDAFMLFDKDEDGKIDYTELADRINLLGPRPTDLELRHMIKNVDENGNGAIEFNEFLEMMITKMKGPDAERAFRKTFKIYDKNDDGLIPSVELRQQMTNHGDKLSEEEVDDMIREADLDGDGMINYDEFVVVLKSIN